ncbi:unnamed protein product [Boreogadus saida]
MTDQQAPQFVCGSNKCAGSEDNISHKVTASPPTPRPTEEGIALTVALTLVTTPFPDPMFISPSQQSKQHEHR